MKKFQFPRLWSVFRKKFGRRRSYIKHSSRTKSNQGQVAKKFAIEVKETIKKLGIKEIWNVDQTPVQYEMITKKTLDNINQKKVWVRCSGKDKERVSVMLLAER